MTFIDIMRTLLEISAFAGLIWCIFHEDTLVAFEERLFTCFKRRRLHIVKQNRSRIY